MSWEWGWFFSELSTFYLWMEEITSCRCWFPAPALKIFLTEEERNRYVERWFPDSNYLPNASGGIPVAHPEDLSQTIGMSNPWGACEISPAGRLSTIDYLNATRSHFQSRDEFIEYELDCDKAIRPGEPESLIECLGIRARALVFCQGIESRSNLWFSFLPLHPARGDILTIETDQLLFDSRVIHHDVWIVPLAPKRFRVGATYDRFTLDGDVDSRPAVLQARSELLQRWERVLSYSTKPSNPLRYEVIEHRAAVRPASYDRKPLIGRHPIFENAYCLNGLGSKGALMAPRLAMHLLDAIDGATIDPRLTCNRKSIL
jgi:glycine/D-amino acid oxidase-like deaminating enzyme